MLALPRLPDGRAGGPAGNHARGRHFQRPQARASRELSEAEAFRHKRLAGQERIRMVTLKDTDGGPPHSRQSKEHGALPGEVFLPEILAGMK